jgi:modulator of FtsH protease
MAEAEYQPYAIAERDARRALLGQTMGLVALTAGLFALGAYVGRDFSGGVGLVAWILSLVCLIAIGPAIRRSEMLAVGLLFAVGLLLGIGTAPMIASYVESDPQAVWQAGGATALFMAGIGTWGYATRRDLSGVGRAAFWALLALIVFGIVLIFVNIPNEALIYSILGLVIFAGLTAWDFQRLSRSSDFTSAPVIAASIFLDALNVFLFFLRIFGNRG